MARVVEMEGVGINVGTYVTGLCWQSRCRLQTVNRYCVVAALDVKGKVLWSTLDDFVGAIIGLLQRGLDSIMTHEDM